MKKLYKDHKDGHTNAMKNRFVICGLTGWCLEIIWTGLCSFMKKDYKLSCNTSFWMFPIYGMGAAIAPISSHLKKVPMVIRGILYAGGIYVAEFVTGSILKRHNVCPWDYSNTRYNYKGLIRLDFAPLWFMVGLLYEWIVNHDS